MAVCLVTGSSRGFGNSICRQLAERGHRVYASMRDTRGTGAKLAQTCELVELDVTDSDAVRRTVERVVEDEGRLDAVVNNAGFVLWGPVEETAVPAIQREFDVNVFGAVRVAQAAAAVMRRQRSGVVVQMSSISGRVVAGSSFRVLLGDDAAWYVRRKPKETTSTAAGSGSSGTFPNEAFARLTVFVGTAPHCRNRRQLAW